MKDKKLTKIEIEDAEFWFETHKCKSNKPKLTYTFHNSTGIGIVVLANCTCGLKEDVTDYSLW